MGWETRKRGGRYYTRSRRVGDRVVREYVGAGVTGQIAALRDELKRLQREEETAYLKEERERFEENTAFLEEIMNAADILVRAHLIARGFRNHKGQWRIRRA